MNDYPNPKVNELLAHVSDFEARDFLDAALAMLDQASVRSAAANRACKAVEVVIAEETPEDEEDPRNWEDNPDDPRGTRGF